MTTTARSLPHAEWIAEGRARYGSDWKAWAFVCPSCGQRQTIGEMISAGMPESMFAFSCIGRALNSEVELGKPTQGHGCNYAGGGLFKLNPVTVTLPAGDRYTFEWADDAHAPKESTP